MIPATWIRPSAGRAVLVAAALAALALVAERWSVRRLIRVHPQGTTAAPYGWVELVPPTPGPWPLLVLLHGASGSGDGRDPGAIVGWLPPLVDAARARRWRRPSILGDAGVLIVAPRSPGPWDTAVLDAFVSHVLASRTVDPDRVYLAGASMGGCGVWRYAAAHAERLAGVVAVNGACEASGALAPSLVALSVRAFHAWDDDVVPNHFSATWVAAVAAQRGADGQSPMWTYPRGEDATAGLTDGRLTWRPGVAAEPGEALTLTEFASGGHRIWRSVLTDDETWRWLLVQRRRAGVGARSAVRR